MNRNDEFYVPWGACKGIYPPEEYVGEAVGIDEAYRYAIEHMNMAEYLKYYYGKEHITNEEIKMALIEELSVVDFYFDDWEIVTEKDMHPLMSDFYAPDSEDSLGLRGEFY